MTATSKSGPSDKTFSASWPMKATSLMTSGVTRPPTLRTTIVTEAEAEEVRRVDARVEAGNQEKAQVGEDDRALVPAGGGEGAVPLERGIEVGHWRGELLVAHRILFLLLGGVSYAPRLRRASRVLAALACHRRW